MPTASLLMFSARRFAGRRADAAGELRKLLEAVQGVERLAVVAAEDQIVPVGMMLLIGQPVWQNGMPQSMQRAPCCCFIVLQVTTNSR